LFGKSEQVKLYFTDSTQTIVDSAFADFSLKEKQSLFQIKKRPTPLFHLFKRKQRANKRVTAAILAFPFPFGIVGLHRIYLGTAPYVPVVYIASLGGVFGILPFIDFCVIALDKDLERYKENKKVFMWVND
jgi:TM2 domain-containing membrane protein YozV